MMRPSKPWSRQCSARSSIDDSSAIAKRWSCEWHALRTARRPPSADAAVCGIALNRLSGGAFSGLPLDTKHFRLSPRTARSTGGSASVSATTRAATSGPSGGMHEGRVLSCRRPSMPSFMNRSCQRQTQVFDLPVRRMISLVPTPSALERMISARQACFCEALRSLVIASSRPRTGRVIVMEIPVRRRQTRTATETGNPNQDSSVRQRPLGRLQEYRRYRKLRVRVLGRAMSPAHAAGESKHHLDAGLKVLICSITGFHKACSVSVRGRDGRGLWPRTWSSRYRNAVGTTHGRRAGDLPRRKREARPDTTRGSPSRRPN